MPNAASSFEHEAGGKLLQFPNVEFRPAIEQAESLKDLPAEVASELGDNVEPIAYLTGLDGVYRPAIDSLPEPKTNQRRENLTRLGMTLGRFLSRRKF